jgi:fatty acid elongase 3
MEAAARQVADLWRAAHEWRFVPGETPYTHWTYPVAAVAAYVATLPVLTRFMATRKPLDFPYLLFAHNMALCIASLVLGSWLTYTLAGQAVVYTRLELICGHGTHDHGHLQLIYYINSFFKVWEFLDTFFLVLRKKPVPFLHWYHHAATLVLTWVQMVEGATCQWVPIVLNLWVHVAMYYYYAMSALGFRVWWKKHLTTLQIAQFVLDVSIVSYALKIFVDGGYDTRACKGTLTAAIVGLGILISYLLLFVRFFVDTYTKKPARSSKKRESATGGAIKAKDA